MSAAAKGVSRLGLGSSKSKNPHAYGGGKDSRSKVTAARTAARDGRLPLARVKVNRSRGVAQPSMNKVAMLGGLMTRMFTVMAASVLLVAVSIGLLTGYRWLTTINYFSIKDVQVTGTKRMAKEDVLTQAELKPGMNLLAVNMENIEGLLAGNPWIESSQVTRVLPDTLKIRVVEREPSFLVQFEDRLCYADGEGRIIDTVASDTFVSLPQVEVESGMERHLAVLEELSKAIAGKKAPFDLDQVAWIRLSWRYGMEIRLMDRNVLLCVGVDDWKTNLSHLNRVWANLAKRGELDLAAIISAQNHKVWVEKHG